jgi:hypothetical protein
MKIEISQKQEVPGSSEKSIFADKTVCKAQGSEDFSQRVY